MSVYMLAKEDRLKSFKNFTQRLRATHEEFAQAGFYFLGVGDRVKCFACCGILQHWLYADNPLIEHARFYPNCPYLLKVKGANFIRGILKLYPGTQRPFQVRSLGAQLAVLRALEESPRPLDSNLVPISESSTQLECKICFDFEANIIFVPCGHIAVCGNCAFRLHKCPICRQDSFDKIQTFIS